MSEKSVISDIRGKHVFIAYRVSVEGIARKIACYLEENSIRVWFFPWKVGWADSVTYKEEKGISDSFAGLIILTPDFLEGKTATEEYRALEAKKRHDRNFKLGVLRVDCPREIIPPFLNDYFDVEISSLEDAMLNEKLKRILRGILGYSLEPSPFGDADTGTKSTFSEILNLIQANQLDVAISLLQAIRDDLNTDDWRTLIRLCCDLIRKNKESSETSTKLVLISTIDIGSSRIFIKEMTSEQKLASEEEQVSSMREILSLFQLVLPRNIRHARNLTIAAFDERHAILANNFLEDIANMNPKTGVGVIYDFLEKYTAQVQGWEKRITENARRVVKPLEITTGEMINGSFSILADSLGRFYPKDLDKFTMFVFPNLERLLLVNAERSDLKEINRLLIQSLPSVDTGLRQLSLAVLSEQGFHEIVPYAGELLSDAGCDRGFLYRIPSFLEKIGCACCIPYLDSCWFVDDYKTVREHAHSVLEEIILRLVETVECTPHAHKAEKLDCKNLPSALQHENKFVRLGALLAVANYLEQSRKANIQSHNTINALMRLLDCRREQEKEEFLTKIVNQILSEDYSSIEWKIEQDPYYLPTSHLYQTMISKDRDQE